MDAEQRGADETGAPSRNAPRAAGGLRPLLGQRDWIPGKRAHANKCGLQAPKRKEFRSRLSPSVYLFGGCAWGHG